MNERTRLLLAGLLLLSCLAAPTWAFAELPAGARVGVLLQMNPYPTHYVSGPAPVNWKQRQYPIDWGVTTEVQKSLVDALEAAGYVPVDLQGTIASIPDLSDVLGKSLSTLPADSHAARVRIALRDELDVAAVILVKDHFTLLNPCGLNCNYMEVRMGLHSHRSVWTNPRVKHTALAPFYWIVAFVDMGKIKPPKAFEKASLKNTFDMDASYQPHDPDEFVGADLLPIRERIVMHLQSVAVLAVDALRDTKGVAKRK